MPDQWHGTLGGYTNHKCRCDQCRAANSAYMKQARLKRRSRQVPDHVHGTVNGYGSYGCRCDECTEAWTADSRARKERITGRPVSAYASKAERKLLADWKEARRENRAINRSERELKKILSRLEVALGLVEARASGKVPFNERYVVNPANGCWEWQGKLQNGYGSYKGMGAHRWSFLDAGGVIPDGMNLDHKCHTEDEACPGGECRHRSCVNPDHLEAVTQMENMLRGRSAAAITLRTGVCQNGHPFEGDNVRVRAHHPRKNRECVQCNRERSRRWRAAQRARLAAYLDK